VKSTLFRPVLLIDEAQEMDTDCLNELRLLQSAHFDSRSLLTTIMCGDMRLPHRFGAAELVSLGSRMRLRMILQPYEREVLLGYLEHALEQSGAPHLMTASLKQTLAEHASGNLRLLNTMAADVLSYGAHKEAPRLDEKLFIELFSHNR
jgi:type II secretory pathway predicted ATPase ExeA